MDTLKQASGQEQDALLCSLVNGLLEGIRDGKVPPVLNRGDMFYSISGTTYMGYNAEKCSLLVAARQLKYPVFGTFNAWKKLGAAPKKGVKSLSLAPGQSYRLKNRDEAPESAKAVICSYEFFNLPDKERALYVPTRNGMVNSIHVFPMEDVEGYSPEFEEGIRELFEGRGASVKFSNKVSDLVIPEDMPLNARRSAYFDAVYDFMQNGEFTVGDGRLRFFTDEMTDESSYSLDDCSITLPPQSEFSSDMEFCADVFRNIGEVYLRNELSSGARYEHSAFWKSISMGDRSVLHSFAAELGASTLLNRLGEPYHFTRHFVEGIDTWLSLSAVDSAAAVSFLAYEAGQVANKISNDMKLTVVNAESVRKGLSSTVEKMQKARELGNDTVRMDGATLNVNTKRKR